MCSFFFGAIVFSNKPRYTSINSIPNIYQAVKVKLNFKKVFQIKIRLTEEHLELSQVFKTKLRQNI